MTLTPRTVGAFTDLSRKLILQSSIDIEGFVRRDLATVLAIAIDLAALHGTGASNQPTGIAATAGIGSVAGGTNGLTPTFAHIISLETEVATPNNADIGTLAYVTNAKVRGKLKGTEKASTTGMYVWQEGATPLNGYNALVSNQVSSALTKGSSSGLFRRSSSGNWADLLIGMWGGRPDGRSVHREHDRHRSGRRAAGRRRGRAPPRVLRCDARRSDHLMRRPRRGNLPGPSLWEFPCS